MIQFLYSFGFDTQGFKSKDIELNKCQGKVKSYKTIELYYVQDTDDEHRSLPPIPNSVQPEPKSTRKLVYQCLKVILDSLLGNCIGIY